MWIFIINILIGIVGFIFVIGYIIETIRFWTLINKLPGPKEFPVIGNLLDMIGDYETIFLNMRKWTREHGSIFKIVNFYHAVVFCTGADDFQLIASGMTNINKSDLYFALDKWLGEGLLTSTGKKWHTRRKILTPAFHFGILKEFVKVLNEETLGLVKILKTMDGNCINIVPLISQTTLKTITETAMGVKLDLQNEKDRNFVNATHGVSNTIFARFMRPWLYLSIPYYYFSSLGREEKKYIFTLHKFCDRVIKEKRKTYTEIEDKRDNVSHSKRKKLALLDILFQAQMEENLIDKQGIKDEVNTFMFEGHDTVAVSICFTLMLLAYHKEVQDLVYQEIVEVIGHTNKFLTINELNNLHYTERCIKESLRLYPSVPCIARHLEEEVTIELGYVLPKKTRVIFNIFDMHRDPKYWNDPEKFDPDRFLPENCLNRHPFAYLPFSAGPRNCIGQKFAILEVKILLCGILRNYKLEAVHNPESLALYQDLLLRPKNGK